MAEPTDAALAARAVGGDTGAFEILVRRHYVAVWRVAFLSVREEMAAEELTQDTFVRAPFTYSLQLTLRDFGARVSIQPPDSGTSP